MKQIKFRAWDKDTSAIVDDRYVSLNYDKIIGNKRFVLMQFTGLLDKNGKEIYFGDICKVDWNDKRYSAHNIEISWNEEMCSIDIEGGLPKKDCENHYEIIGNIYQNAELLK